MHFPPVFAFRPTVRTSCSPTRLFPRHHLHRAFLPQQPRAFQARCITQPPSLLSPLVPVPCWCRHPHLRLHQTCTVPMGASCHRLPHPHRSFQPTDSRLHRCPVNTWPGSCLEALYRRHHLPLHLSCKGSVYPPPPGCLNKVVRTPLAPVNFMCNDVASRGVHRTTNGFGVRLVSLMVNTVPLIKLNNTNFGFVQDQ